MNCMHKLKTKYGSKMKKMNFRLIALLILGILPFYSISQNGNLLIIAEPGFRVYVDEDFKGYTIEEQDGIFLEKIPTGKRKITIKKSGNETKEANVEITVGKTAEIDFNNLNSSVSKNDNHGDKNEFSEKVKYFEENSSGIYRDERDNQLYDWVKIGGVIWMADNLNYKTVDSYCLRNDKSNCDKYGRLYIWESAMVACPEGWHLASDNEWRDLEMGLGMRESEFNIERGERNKVVARQLKSTTGWSATSFENGNNSSGLSILPSGTLRVKGYFSWITLYWTSTKRGQYNAYYREFNNDIGRSTTDLEAGCAVRCVRD